MGLHMAATYIRALRAAYTFMNNSVGVPPDSRKDDIVEVLRDELSRYATPKDNKRVQTRAIAFKAGDVVVARLGYADIPKGASLIVERIVGDKYMVYLRDNPECVRVVKGTGLRYPSVGDTAPTEDTDVPEEAMPSDIEALNAARMGPTQLLRTRGAPAKLPLARRNGLV